MNVFGQSERSWRKARKRGVSPIIATILLVAITVVLAAVLYVLISGLTRGPGNTPLGTAIGFGPATPTHSTTAPSTGCPTNAYCYTVSIASASGVTSSDLQFKATDASGAPATALVNVTLVGLSGSALALWTGAGGSASATIAITTADYFVVDMGTSSVSGLGDSLVALGVGSYSGSVSVALP